MLIENQTLFRYSSYFPGPAPTIRRAAYSQILYLKRRYYNAQIVYCCRKNKKGQTSQNFVKLRLPCAFDKAIASFYTMYVCNW